MSKYIKIILVIAIVFIAQKTLATATVFNLTDNGNSCTAFSGSNICAEAFIPTTDITVSSVTFKGFNPSNNSTTISWEIDHANGNLSYGSIDHYQIYGGGTIATSSTPTVYTLPAQGGYGGSFVLTAGQIYVVWIYDSNYPQFQMMYNSSTNFQNDTIKRAKVNHNGTGWNGFAGGDIYFSINAVVQATCIDGIQNQDETGIDTGGVCTTRITNVVPINNTTTASTNVAFSFDYFLNALNSTGGETGLKVYFTRVDTAGQGQTMNYLWNSIVTGTLTTLTHNFTLPSGSMWDYSVWFERDPSYFINEYQPVPLPNGRFSVVTNPTTGTTGYVTCDIANLAGCFQNAIMYLFYPSQNSLTQFGALKNIIINKPPVGYVYGVINALGSVNLSATPTLSFATFTPVNTYIFSPLRAGFIWVFWFVFLFLLFKRFQHLDL
jgi:hypothetical protein